MRQLFILGRWLCIAAGFAACKKPPFNPPPQYLCVTLNNYMPQAKVDSAFAIWETNGQKQVIPLERKDNVLFAALRKFRQGTGRLQVSIRSNIQFSNASSEWVHEEQASIQHNIDKTIPGPASYNDAQWLPRAVIVISHAGKTLLGVLGMRPGDPYFSFQHNSSVSEILVGRSYFHITPSRNDQIAGKEWKCVNACGQVNGLIENTTHFRSLKEEVGTRQWNIIEYEIYMGFQNPFETFGYQLTYQPN
jgi:hypothetical protein